MVRKEKLEIISTDPSSLLEIVPSSLSSLEYLSLNSRNDERTVINRVSQALDIQAVNTATEPVPTVNQTAR